MNIDKRLIIILIMGLLIRFDILMVKICVLVIDDWFVIWLRVCGMIDKFDWIFIFVKLEIIVNKLNKISRIYWCFFNLGCFKVCFIKGICIKV